MYDACREKGSGMKSHGAKRLKLGMSMRGLGYHPAAWRHPAVPADGTLRFDHYLRVAKAAERGKLDMIFFADGLGIRESDMPRGARVRSGYELVELEPMTLLPALAPLTRHIGLVATASTSYNEPFHIARKFASLDIISGGRAGWNVVTAWSTAEAQNFNRDQHYDYETRYDRAKDFVDVVEGLWDSWESDALLYDRKSGHFYDEAKMHVLAHASRHFKVRGPLNVAATPQGRPIIIQAGAAGQGRELAAAHADVIYAGQNTLAEAREFYDDVKARLPGYGREPDDLKIMPGLRPIVAPTRAEAQAKFDALQDLLDPLVCLSRAYNVLGDLSDFDPDGPVPEPKNALRMKSFVDRLVHVARERKLSIREFGRYVAGEGGGGHCIIGTAADVADTMQEWFEAGACDGFNITPNQLPGGCEDFVDMVVPELQRRGLFRREYEGTTLRDNLGLKPHVNRYAAARVREGA